MNWILCFKLVDGQYELAEYGSDLIITQSYDKTLPVAEHVAKQGHKLYYDGESLRLKEGQQLLSLEELNAEQLAADRENGIAKQPKPQLVEVVL